MILANLADDYKDFGMQFEELEVSGDIHTPLRGPCVLMDGQYVYYTGKQVDHQLIDIYRIDLSNKKWELLYKSCIGCSELDRLCEYQVVFYKGGIFVFGYTRINYINDDHAFLVSMKHV